MPDDFWTVFAVVVVVAFAAYTLWDMRNAKHLEEALNQLIEARCEIFELRQRIKELEGKAVKGEKHVRKN